MAATPKVTQDIDVQTLWAKYEDIAMHFNDLLMRLRSQSLAGVAAVSALVGIFSKEGALDVHLEWVVAEAIFAALAVFWIAIWCLDLLYYNRLLKGAVRAIKRLEEQTKPQTKFDGYIEMSTMIEAEFSNKVLGMKGRFAGVVTFYVMVLLVIGAGIVFSDLMRRSDTPVSSKRQMSITWTAR